MSHEMPYQDAIPVAAEELGKVLPNWVINRQFFAIGETHHRRARHWLGDRGAEEDSIRVRSFAESTIQDFFPCLNVKRRCRDLSGFRLSLDQSRGFIQLTLTQRKRNAAE